MVCLSIHFEKSLGINGIGRDKNGELFLVKQNPLFVNSLRDGNGIFRGSVTLAKPNRPAVRIHRASKPALSQAVVRDLVGLRDESIGRPSNAAEISRNGKRERRNVRADNGNNDFSFCRPFLRDDLSFRLANLLDQILSDF